jgi:hypothetical protein
MNIARAATPVIYAGIMLTCLSLRAEAAQIPDCVDCPADPDTFLTMLEKAVIEDADTATAYYAEVDPFSEKTTIADWYAEAGFIDSAASYNSSGPITFAADVKSVTHKNVADLNFVRFMSSRCVPDCDDPNPKIFSSIENYLTFEDAKNRVNRLASVTMEWTSAADGSQPSDRFVVFYAYTGTTAGTAQPDSRSVGVAPNTVPFAPDLDGRGTKEIPGLCDTCHGGAPLNLNADGSYPNHGNTGALFLPLDLDNFEFDESDATKSQAAQEAIYKRLNEMALVTHRSIEEFDEVAGFARLPTGHDLIEGWYGGPGMPNATFHGEYVPEGWLPPAAPADAETLYLEAIAPACRSCHAQQELSLDFGTYAGFMSYEIAHQNLVLEIECGIDDDPATRGNGLDNQAVMPMALQTYKRFWDPATPAPVATYSTASPTMSQADVFKQYFEPASCNAGTGCH